MRGRETTVDSFFFFFFILLDTAYLTERTGSPGVFLQISISMGIAAAALLEQTPGKVGELFAKLL